MLKMEGEMKVRLRCAVLDDYQRVASNMADWSLISEQVEIKFLHEYFDNENDLVSAISDCDIIVIMRERTAFGASLFSRLSELKLLVTTGMKNSAIDLAAAHSHGVLVCGTATHPEPPTEHTWALILGLARNLVVESNALRTNGPWQSTVGMDLNGRRLGIFGLGKIGSRVARVGLSFGMEVTAWSSNLTKEKCDAAGVNLASSKEELLSTSDFVSIHLVLSDRTRGLLSAEELRLMRPSAFLINTSRASIVDQDALVEALQKGWIAGAGLDVFEKEPLAKNDVLRSLPNVLATPHNGYVTQANYQTFYREAVEDIQAFLAGSPIRTLS
jgi:phosphoglycerate dehydrogenase-like enzyme